ncbi:MAG: ergothioneine biosynthesis protein EgtB [candidate division Zixibacteria bacterium]
MLTEKKRQMDSKESGSSGWTRDSLSDCYSRIRAKSVELCEPLVTEDYVIQSIEDVSPPKWHLGHITWFFEQVILETFVPDYEAFNKEYYFVFNSYYNSFGDRVMRTSRGTVSRPTVEEVYQYRRDIDTKMNDLFQSIDKKKLQEMAELVVLGLNHEQQHQELLLTDIKHNFAANPLQLIYKKTENGTKSAEPITAEFIDFDEGLHTIGNARAGFSWDNERPGHKVYVNKFKLMNRLVTCGEFLQFIEDGGYKKAALWLSDGWDKINNENWEQPLYWLKKEGLWFVWSLSGLRLLNPAEPVCHLSYYEADAYANWSGDRLPTEAEWEMAALKTCQESKQGNFMESGTFHPMPASANGGSKLKQMMGDVWEWTASAYLPYPGYPRYPGPLGEYNGKFMSDQMVLRGGSCVTSRDHIRITYRNFFQCDKRWQMTGMRLAKDS